MHDAHVLDGHVLHEELDHPRNGARPRADPVHGLDLAIDHQQEGLEVEHRADHRLRAAHPSAHLDVAQGVEESEHATPGNPLLDGRRGLVQRRTFGRNAAEEGHGHRHGLAVDDADAKTFNGLSAHPRGFSGGGELPPDVDRDATVVVLGETRVKLGKLAGRRRGGRGQLGGRGKPRKELFVAHVHAVAERFLPKQDFERDDLDVVALAPLVRKVRGRVGDDGEGTLQKISRPARAQGAFTRPTG